MYQAGATSVFFVKKQGFRVQWWNVSICMSETNNTCALLMSPTVFNLYLCKESWHSLSKIKE